MTGGRQHYVGQLLLNLDLFVCPLFATLVTTKITGRKYIYFCSNEPLRPNVLVQPLKVSKLKMPK